MIGFFRRFFLSDFGPPPPPDVSHQPGIAGQSIDEILYSDSKCERAIITHDVSGIYRIHMQFWDIKDWKAGHGAFWYDEGSGSYTDTLELARKLAQEKLHTDKPNEATASSTDDIDTILRRDAAFSWGLGLLFSGAMGCSGASYYLYWFAIEEGGGSVSLIVDGLLCMPFALLSCIGFIQVVSGTTCNRLHDVWPSLNFGRRFSILLFITGAIYFLAPFTYFLMTLSPSIDGDI